MKIMSHVNQNNPRNNFSKIHERRRLWERSKDSDARIKMDIEKWSKIDPEYGLIVEGILESLRYRANR